MTSEAAVSSPPAIGSTPAQRDYYWIRSFVAGGTEYYQSNLSCVLLCTCCVHAVFKFSYEENVSFKQTEKQVYLPAKC